MIRVRDTPASSDPARTTLVVGSDLTDALSCFGQQDDCIGCSTAVAAPRGTMDRTIQQICTVLVPLSTCAEWVRPSSAPSGMLRRGGYWTDVDVDARAQRLSTVKMPSSLVGSQRLLAINDLRNETAARPVIAIGLWAAFAHPIVRAGARFGGTTDGLTAEIALAVHPDRYAIVSRDRKNELTFLLATPDIMVAELVTLALPAERGRFRGPGPWEDPLVQAATDLDLGVRTPDEIDIEAVISPTLSAERRMRAGSLIVEAVEQIGVSTAM
ncbi:MAG: hypothetical protein R2848_15765 [Thermomicrobiales bacterium]